MAGDNRPCVLGIDIGTSSIKLAVIEKSSQLLLRTCSKPSNANIPTAVPIGAFEQNVSCIFSALSECMILINQWVDRIDTIAVTGQMHGVVLWQHKESCELPSQHFDFKDLSSLYTWQDARCSRVFLDQLPIDPFSSISTGYGCATLFWLQQNQAEFLSQFNRAGTIQDFLVALLCDLPFPLMCEQNAASWGYFDLINKAWNLEKLESCNFPTHLLPKIKASGSFAGELKDDWFGIKRGTNVSVALGDFQCAFYALHERDTDAVISISTSAQLALLLPKNFVPGPPYPAVLWAPYFDDLFLAEAASLNGGNVLAAFVKMLQEWLRVLGIEVPDEHSLWAKLLSASKENTENDLTVCPTLFGERNSPEKCCSIGNINPSNTSLDAIFHALCASLVSNLRSLMPKTLFEKADVDRIVATGSVIARNAIIRDEIKRQFADIPVIVKEECDAATGAALVMLK